MTSHPRVSPIALAAGFAVAAGVLSPAPASASLLLLAAGGGGGAGCCGVAGDSAPVAFNGDNGTDSNAGPGGVNGQGGQGGQHTDDNGGGGAGWLSNGGNGLGYPAFSALSGKRGFGPPTFLAGLGGAFPLFAPPNNNGGYGLDFGGDITLTAGTTLGIVVGGGGASGNFGDQWAGGGGGGSFVYVVPEPSTWAMMLLGFAGLGSLGYRRAARAKRAAIAA